MASLSNDPNGFRRLTFSESDGSRRTIRLGKMPRKAAEVVRLRVQALIACDRAGVPWDADLASWVGSLHDELHERIARVGLVPPRATTAATVGDLLQRFEDSSTVKPATIAAYRQGIESIRVAFGDGRSLRSITVAEAEAWRKGLADEGLARATQAKRTRVAKAVFRSAVRWGLIPSSPFEDLRCGSQTNAERLVYVDRDTATAVLDACPSDEWRAIVALVRFAGLRCPSELAPLTWADVDFDKGRLTVRSPKTEHHEGRGVRMVPLCAELREILDRLFAAAAEGEVAVLPTLSDPRRNLRTQLVRIIERAGVKPWPKPLQNLRASCACDWAERFPAHVVAGWCGHTPLVAAKHYLTVRDAHFHAAADIDADGGAQRGAPAAHKAARRPTPQKSARVHALAETPTTQAVADSHGDRRTSAEKRQVGWVGFEPTSWRL